MKRYTFLVIMMCCFYASKAKYEDSVKIIRFNDTTFGLAVYGVLLPSGPCTIIDSVKTITEDSITVQLCYLANWGSGSFCFKSDTILLGNLPNPSYQVSVYFNTTDSIHNTCSTTNLRDTTYFAYVISGIDDKVSFTSPKLFPIPTNGRLTCIVPEQSKQTTITLMAYDGSICFMEKHQGDDSIHMDISDLSQGLYIVQLITDGKRYIQKIVRR